MHVHALLLTEGAFNERAETNGQALSPGTSLHGQSQLLYSVCESLLAPFPLALFFLSTLPAGTTGPTKSRIFPRFMQLGGSTSRSFWVRGSYVTHRGDPP